MSSLVDCPSLIYGLEKKARALTSDQSDTDQINFIVGTESVNYTNEIHVVSVDEWGEGVEGRVIPFNGEVCDISSSTNGLFGITWKSEGLFYTSICNLDEGSLSFSAQMLRQKERIISTHWDNHRPLSVSSNGLSIFDLTNESTTHSLGHSNVYSGGWMTSTCVIMAGDSFIQGRDLRIPNKPTWVIEEEGVILCVESNPNSPHVVMRGGDDSHLLLWDIRNTSSPLVDVSYHSHWLWKAHFNKFHDQLILSAGSDGLVLLHNIVSVCSDLFLHEHEFNELDMSRDCLLKTYQDHEDSVYCVEWSAADPWMFASLSYDGRLAINRLPDVVKLGLI